MDSGEEIRRFRSRTWTRVGPAYLVKELEELGAGLVDGADDGSATLGQPFHQ